MTEWCQKHWDMLREEVVVQGMGDFISANGEIAMMKVTSELQGEESDLTNFDPLMRCFWMIEGRTLEIAGLDALHPEFGCPICTFNKGRSEDGRCLCSDPNCLGKEPGSVPDHEEWLVGENSTVAAVKAMMIEKGWLSV